MVELTHLTYLLSAFGLVAGQVDLKSAATFAVLGASAITNTLVSVIVGNVGISPGTAITGITPAMVTGGTIVTAAQAALAHSDALAAFTNGNSLPGAISLTGLDLGGMILTPGVYQFSSSAFLTGGLILDGQGNSASNWTFQIGSTLITSAGSSVTLINGAKASNCFWMVGSSATIATVNKFAGSIIAYASITVGVGAIMNGGVFVLTAAITLANNAITAPGAVFAPAPIVVAPIVVAPIVVAPVVTSSVVTSSVVTSSVVTSSVVSVPVVTTAPVVTVPVVTATCYADNIGSNGRTMNKASLYTNSMTNEACQAYCTGIGYFYSGTEYSAECYCSNTSPTTLSNACTMPCNGNATEICGGPNALTVNYNSAAAASTAILMTQYLPAGCYSEYSPTRALAGSSLSSQYMSVENCVRFCKSGGYSIAGVEYSYQCFCDNSITSNGATLGVPSSGCSSACSGNSAETCGGSNLLNIYSTQPTLALNLITAAPFTASNAVGQCASDWAPGNNNQRVLSGKATSSSSMTPAVCLSFCSAYRFYGVEYSSECYCGNTISSTSMGANNCTSTCSGDSTQICGGGWAMNIRINPSYISS